MSPTHQRRFGAVVAYDGTDFAGFQRQKDEFRTVQGEIERVLSQIASDEVSLTAAGRTDAGVHATGQVIAFEMAWKHDVATLRQALNVNLPGDIAVQAVHHAPERFHPRFDARRREYQYLIDILPEGIRWPFSNRSRWQIHRLLDLELMNQAAAALVGTHDFATFGTPPQGDNTVREVFAAGWSGTKLKPHRHALTFTIQANAFLFRMVRTIVGTLVQVGRGSWSLARFEDALSRCDRALAASPAPANGLYLTKVTYPAWPEKIETYLEIDRERPS